ncbi:MAG: GGDEF domain-containing protein [Betaproteobacteria bacterium]|nr:GGDEF domain-containing protein [Betaproteobacteria bacterium]
MRMLDVATLLNLLALDCAVFALLILTTAWDKLGDGRREWCAALVTQALGWSLLAFGPSRWPWTQMPAIACIHLGLSFYGLAMARLAQVPVPRIGYFAPPLLAALLYTLTSGNPIARAHIINFIAAAQFLLCLYPLARSENEPRLTTRKIVAASFCLGIFGYLLHSVQIAYLSGSDFDYFSNNNANATFFLIHHLNIVFGNIGIALMYRERAVAEGQRQSHLDPLTEILNRHSFLEHAARELLRAESAGTPVAGLIIDLEAFKRINEAYGQLAGDRVLCHFARLLSHSLRGEDLCARWSGASFCALLSDANEDGAARFAERLQTVAATNHVAPDDIGYRIRIGIAACQPGACEAHALFARAEAALRAAKAQTTAQVGDEVAA